MTTDTLKIKENLCPEFAKIIGEINRINPLQAKRLATFFARQDTAYWEFCEDLSRTLNQSLFAGQMKEAAESYNELCLRMLRDQIQFRKTGVYQIKDSAVAKKEVYENAEFMRRYMVGLLLTQMLWSNHYQLFRFFQSYLADSRPQRYLEVGAGHGLFLVEAKRRFPSLEAVVCDVSQTSVDFCSRIVEAFGIDPKTIMFRCEDFFKVDLGKELFDFISAGEVLEHVNDAPNFLRRLQGFLKPAGRVYLSTCANCPAPDHVYHFRNIDEIRDLIRGSGFTIEQEIFLPAEGIPVERWEKELITVNYAAILKLKKK